MNSRKYTLKPGKHQFAPGSPAEHDNDNSSDEEIAWYLKAYPHIAALLVEKSLKEDNSEKPKAKRNRNFQNQKDESTSIKSIGEINLIKEITTKKSV